jgi:DNA transformation protein
MIALVADGELYLKTNAETAEAFRAENMRPFQYGKKGRRVVMSYWRMPDRLLDDTDELAVWARTAFKAAERAAAANTTKRRIAGRKTARRRR